MNNNVDIKAIGKRLKTARVMRGLNVEQVGELVGVSKQTVSKYEKGIINISICTIGDLANALDVSISYILGIGATVELDGKPVEVVSDGEETPNDMKYLLKELQILDTKRAEIMTKLMLQAFNK